MDYQDYYPNNYLKDKDYYNSLRRPNCFCGRVTLAFIKDGIIDDKNFVDAKKFLICEYELNLIGQILHSYFPIEYYTAWTKANPHYLHKFCGYGTPATGIPLGIEHAMSRKITKTDILNADKFFMDLLFAILKKENLLQHKSKNEFIKELLNKISEDRTIKFIMSKLDRLSS